MRTAAEVDAKLLATREQFYECIRLGDLDGADELYRELDRLLDERTHIPLLPSARDGHTSPRPR